MGLIPDIWLILTILFVFKLSPAWSFFYFVSCQSRNTQTTFVSVYNPPSTLCLVFFYWICCQLDSIHATFDTVWNPLVLLGVLLTSAFNWNLFLMQLKLAAHCRADNFQKAKSIKHSFCIYIFFFHFIYLTFMVLIASINVSSTSWTKFDKLYRKT